MFKKTKVCSAVLMAIGSAATLAPVAAMAQQTLDRVEITGSRIVSPNADSPSPLQVITAKDIAASGAVNIQELLLKSPVMGQPTFSRTNSNFDTSNSGVATIDLRGLGSSRTLVLVNGRRFVAGVPGTSAVDLNSIPTDFIERIELLTGGASSTYGSDAVAGVVNIILKKDFEGFVADASAGLSQKSDDAKRKLALTWGANLAGGKGNVMAHFGYSRQGAVYSKDRAGNEVDNISVAALTGSVNDLFTFQAPFYSSFAPQGRVFLNPGVDTTSRTFDANGNVVPWSTNGPAGDGVGARGFNRQDFRTIAVPTERYLFASKGDFEFLPDQRAFFEGTYSSATSTSRLEPFPLSASGTNGIYPQTGKVPADFLVNGVRVKNPLLPTAIYNLLTPDADGARFYDFTKRLSEVGNRGNVADLDTFRAVTGVKGTLLKAWDYELFASYGQSKRSQVSGGQVNVLNFRNALEAIPDVDDVNGNGNRTEAICRDADARAQGCVPINVFGLNAASAAALKYIDAPSFLSTKTTQETFGASVSGEAFSLPAGGVGVALGAEYRKEYSRSEFDPLSQAGLNGGNAIPRTEGQFNVKELFAEARVPLLKDSPFAKSLSVTGAVRGGKYSTVGNTLSWSTGVEWAITSDVKLRATRALSTRAPDINDLFSPPTQTFPQVSDPCVGVTATSTTPVSAACRANPGVAANIATNGSFTLTQADLQGTSGFDRGNPNLGEEEGRSTTIGLIFTPRSIPFLKNTAFTADYFNIKIDKAIVQTPRQFILNQCYGGDASFCQFVTRNATPVGANSAGFLAFVDAAVTNSGGLGTSGIDLTASYSDMIGPGRLNGRVSYTRLISGYQIPLPGAAKDIFAGEIGSARNRGALTLGYTTGPWSVNSQFTYIGASAVDDQILATLCADDPSVCAVTAAPGSVKVPAKIYTDLQVTFTQGKVQYYFGVDNVFGTKAPRIDTNDVFGISSGSTGVGTAGDVYDPIGRRYSVGLRLNF